MIAEGIQHLLNWSDAKLVNTRRGPRLLKSAQIPADFWDTWRNQKEDLKAAGMSITKNEDTGAWEALWWIDPGTETVPVETNNTSEPVKSVLTFDTGLEEVAPIGSKLLREYQIPAALTHLQAFKKHNFSIDSSDMGMGKTYIAGAVAEAYQKLGYEIGVVCPANVKDKWRQTLELFHVEPLFVESFDKLRRGTTGALSRKVLANRNTGKEIREWTWNLDRKKTLVVMDEIHVCGALKSQNAEMLTSLSETGVKILGLSGTVANDPTSLKAIGQALELHKGKDFWRWCLANGCHEGKWGGIQFTANKSLQHQHLTNIHRKIYPERGARLLKSELKDKLPPQLVQPESVTIDNTGDKIHRVIQESIARVFEASAADDARAMDKEQDVSGATRNLRARQIAELELIPWIVENALESWDQGAAVAIFCLFDDSIDCVKHLLSHAHKLVLEYSGRMSDTERRGSLQTFQSNLCRRLVLNLAAGAQSIDLHDTLGTAPRIAYIVPTYSAKLLLQAMGRFDRDGKRTPSIIKLPFAAGGVQEHIMKNVQGKLDNLALLQDGDLDLKMDVLQKIKK